MSGRCVRPLGMTVFIDPVPNMYPHCVCDQSPEIMCEWPCWQQLGLNDDFDPSDPNSCCCAREAKRRGIDVKPKTAEERAAEKVTFERWLGEKRKEWRARANQDH